MTRRQPGHEYRFHLGPEGTVANIPANYAFLARLRTTPSLTPAQLVRMARIYKRSPATISLAHHMLENAAKMVAVRQLARAERAVEPAGLYWRELSRVVDPSLLEPEDEEAGLQPQGEGPSEPTVPGVPPAPEGLCEFKCAWWFVFLVGTGIFFEDCGQGWRPIGVCITDEDYTRTDEG